MLSRPEFSPGLEVGQEANPSSGSNPYDLLENFTKAKKEMILAIFSGLRGTKFHYYSVKINYSAGQKKRYKHCFMKQTLQLQMGIAQYRNVATPLSTRGIDTTH